MDFFQPHRLTLICCSSTGSLCSDTATASSTVPAFTVLPHRSLVVLASTCRWITKEMVHLGWSSVVETLIFQLPGFPQPLHLGPGFFGTFDAYLSIPRRTCWTNSSQRFSSTMPLAVRQRIKLHSAASSNTSLGAGGKVLDAAKSQVKEQANMSMAQRYTGIPMNSNEPTNWVRVGNFIHFRIQPPSCFWLSQSQLTWILWQCLQHSYAWTLNPVTWWSMGKPRTKSTRGICLQIFKVSCQISNYAFSILRYMNIYIIYIYILSYLLWILQIEPTSSVSPMICFSHFSPSLSDGHCLNPWHARLLGTFSPLQAPGLGRVAMRQDHPIFHGDEAAVGTRHDVKLRPNSGCDFAGVWLIQHHRQLSWQK